MKEVKTLLGEMNVEARKSLYQKASEGEEDCGMTDEEAFLLLREKGLCGIVENGKACIQVAEHGHDVENQTALRLAKWLRVQAVTSLQRIRPNDAREAEDCGLAEAVLLDAATAIERGEWRE